MYFSSILGDRQQNNIIIIPVGNVSRRRLFEFDDEIRLRTEHERCSDRSHCSWYQNTILQRDYICRSYFRFCCSPDDDRRTVYNNNNIVGPNRTVVFSDGVYRRSCGMLMDAYPHVVGTEIRDEERPIIIITEPSLRRRSRIAQQQLRPYNVT